MRAVSVNNLCLPLDTRNKRSRVKDLELNRKRWKKDFFPLLVLYAKRAISLFRVDHLAPQLAFFFLLFQCSMDYRTYAKTFATVSARVEAVIPAV